MSVLIKRMKMPSMCSECDFVSSAIMRNGKYICECTSAKACGKNVTEAARKGIRDLDCPLVEVPEPHGRLIDANEMFVEFVIEGQRSKRYKLGEKWELNGEEIRSVISRLPTIIPASEEGER